MKLQRQPLNARQRARRLSGLSQDVVARAVGIDRSLLSRWERGFVRLGIARVRKIAACLDVPPDELKLDSPSTD